MKYKPVFDKFERGFLTGKELKAIEDFTTDIERLSIVIDLFTFVSTQELHMLIL